MARRRASARSAASALLVAAGVLALGLSGSAGAGVKAPHCASNRLSPVFVSTTAAMGSRDAEYGFENHSTRSCELTGYPRLTMLTKSGHALSTTVLHTALGALGIKISQVTLGHEAVAYFDVHYASSTGFGRLNCPTSAALVLTAPGDTKGLVLRGSAGRIQPYGGTTVHLDCGIVYVSPLTAKRFQ